MGMLPQVYDSRKIDGILSRIEPHPSRSGLNAMSCALPGING